MQQHVAIDESIIEQVKQYYGKVLQSTKDLKTSACCTEGKPALPIRRALQRIPQSVMDKYYGCGNPIPLGAVSGLTVLDLGCGSGRDCFIAAQLVGPQGRVIGVDMTEEQLQVARSAVPEFRRGLPVDQFSATTIEFKSGYIELLQETAGVQPASVDLVISNCVVNLSPRKDLVLRSVFSVLREGGEFHFSDVYCDRRLPDSVRKHQLLWGECIAGAMYIEDFKQLAREVGFKDPRLLSIRQLSIDEEFEPVLGAARFYSITFRLFKLKSLEERCEDYGQVGRYLGGIEGSLSSYQLDAGHSFEQGKPVLICGNTAAIIGQSWLKQYFRVDGDTDTHYGLFDCGTGSTASNSYSAIASGVGNSCSPGTCC